MTTKIFGGFGQDAVGRHQFGAPDSVIEPTFNTSMPVDGAQDVAREQWITFTTYYYSSIANFPEGILVEVSEDGGVTFESVDAPVYTATTRVKDGQQIWVKIRKNWDGWPPREKIVVRYTGVDEFGNAAVKSSPVRWAE